MTWENIIKKKPLVGGQKKLDVDNDGDIDGDDFSQLRKNNTEINLCYATVCRHNEINKCTLEDINVSSKGECQSFNEKNTPTGFDAADRQERFENDNV